MYSLAWPNMFNANNVSVNLLQDKAAVASNLLRLLNCERRTLFGDPYFGTNLKRVLYQQNSSILIDQLREELYTTIQMYVPQIYVPREAIIIKSTDQDLIAEIRVTYLIDNSVTLYNINLTSNTQEG